MRVSVREAEPGEVALYKPYGGASEFLYYQGPEAIVTGPAETGKTLAMLWKIHVCAMQYPGASIVLCRKVLADTYSTVLVTFQERVLAVAGGEHVARAYGGKKPEWYDYSNGSRIWIAGLDKSSKVLSGEHDMVAVNQAEELFLEDWETLTTRTTGRKGAMPWSQTIGDINPTYPYHWIYTRPSLKMFYSHHDENPLLFDQVTGLITPQGEKTMATLDNLTGVRRSRLRDGVPARVEGVVYDGWDPAFHQVDARPIPDTWRKFRVVDFGLRNPFVCHWWAVDPDDRMHRYREIYMTGRTVRRHAQRIQKVERWYITEGEREQLAPYIDGDTGELLEAYDWDDDGYLIDARRRLVPNPKREAGIETTVCDHDAEDRATLEENDIPTIAAKKSISVGVQKVQERLVRRLDKTYGLVYHRGVTLERDPSLEMLRKPLCTEQEYDGYVWPKGVGGKAVKEIPVKVNDHGMDTTRYAVMYIDGEDSVAADAYIPGIDPMIAIDKGGFA